MTRRQLITTSAPAAFSFSQRPAKPPNIVLLLTDDQGYGDLACLGNPWIRTPNLDRLHGESVRFTDYHCDPLCAPTRAGLLTGQYALRNGVTAATGGWSLLRPGVPTIADILRRAGYRTGIFGKWHLGENYPLRPSDRGFDESVVCRTGGVAQAGDYWGNRYFDDHYYAQNEPRPYRGYCTDVFFDLAKEFIEKHKDRPFFLYLPTNAPHAPYLVSEKYSAPYRRTGIPSPAAEFYGMIENLDQNVGALRAHLDKLDLTRNTIFVFMTDNGSSAGTPRPGQASPNWKGFSAGMRAAKASAYEGGHRVPLFVHWPAGGWQGGRDVGGLACHLDLLPTLTSMAGVEVPEVKDIDGRSLVPLLKDPETFAGRVHFIEHHQVTKEGRYQMEYARPWMQSVALRGRWRLVNRTELYDLQSDPGQQNNVAGQHPDVLKDLAERYENWWQRMSTGFKQWTRIPLGSAINPVELTCFDWHGDLVPANQEMISAGLTANGIFALHVERAGTYELTLRQRPAYVPFRLEAEHARVWINGRELSPQTVAGGSSAVTFTSHLARGDLNLMSMLQDGSRQRGAYFVDIRLRNSDRRG